MSGRKHELRVVAVETEFKASNNSNFGEFARVVFRVRVPPLEWNLPIYVPREKYDDADIVLAARNLLHRTLRVLTEQTQGWLITPEEAGSRQTSDKSNRKGDPT